MSQWSTRKVEMARRPDGSMVAVDADTTVAGLEPDPAPLDEARADHDQDTRSSTASPVTTEHSSRPAAARFVHPGHQLVPTGAKARARANIAAVQIVRTCREEQRPATPAEQDVLAQWSGWGAIPEIFDESRGEWAADRARLRELLGPDEWADARASTLNAHYTDPAIAQVMWDALQRAGFESGRVLEPGAGSGTFIALAPEDAVMVGVEKDPVTAEVAHLLNPHAQVRLEGFEVTNVPERSFDAVIGNVPFGKFSVPDPVWNPHNHSIHNAFLIKSLHLTEPGGWVMAITTAGTLDAQNRRSREALAELADLVGAVRLPTDAFKDVAGTSVVTDILMFRRLDSPRPKWDKPAWIDTTEVDVPAADGGLESVRINAYFTEPEHREHVLGTLSVGRGLYRDGSLTVTGRDADRPLADQVREALTDVVDRALRQGAGHSPRPRTEDQIHKFATGLGTPATLYADQVTPGHIRYDVERNVFESADFSGQWQELTMPKSRMKEARHLLRLRDLGTELIAEQTSEASNPDRKAQLRKELNAVYDAYHSAYGPINRFAVHGGRARTPEEAAERLATRVQKWRVANPETNGRPWQGELPEDTLAALTEEAWAPTSVSVRQPHLEKLRRDPGLSVVLSLENFNEDDQSARKADIFVRDVVVAPERAEHAESSADAVAITMAEKGRVDLERIGELLGLQDHDELRTALGDTVFISPDGTGDLIPAEHLLTGNVRQRHTRLTELASAAEDTVLAGEYTRAAAAVAEVIPNDLAATDIGQVQPGVTWVSLEDYRQFIVEALGGPSDTTVERAAGSWVVTGSPYRSDRARYESEFGAESRDSRKSLNAGQLFQKLLNQEPIKVSNPQSEIEAGAPLVDQEATIRAQVQAEKIAAEFGRWVWSDPERSTRLLREFNDRFNSFVPPAYDGSHLTLPGLSPDFEPHPYQRAAVARMIAEPTVLLDHVVGAGKTGSMLMGAMELKRRGLVSQPWLVVPTHLIEQMTRESKQWYPAAQILAGRRGMTDEDRRQFVAQTAVKEWDLVIIPASVFERINVHPDRRRNHLERQLVELGIELDQKLGSGSTATIKRIEQAKKTLEKRIAKLQTLKLDDGVRFEQSGCDYLIVDEAHGYKNRQRVASIDSLAHVGSAKAEDLAMKLDLLRERARHKALAEGRWLVPGQEKVATFATGTPIANSLAEAWVMQSYMRPDILASAGVASVNDWSAMFTKTTSQTVTNATGTQLRVVSSVNSFSNVQSMYALSAVFSDVVVRDQVPANLPKFGARKMILTEPGQEVRDFITDLEYRSDHMPDDPRLDNPLKVLNDGRNVALDPRLVGLTPSEDGRTRAEAVAETVAAIHHRDNERVYNDGAGQPSPIPGSLQVVFCDRGTPKPGGQWSVYDAVRGELEQRGVPAEQIRFIHDAVTPAQRNQLFDDCLAGRVRVLIGSTERMGTGMNVQRRLVALHHMDVPWRPADLEQREGRIIRQGNQNDEVEIYSYATAGTTDTIMWGKVEAKAAFISQYKQGLIDNTADVADIEEQSLTEAAAATKAAATGDERFMRMVELQNDVDRLTALENTFRDAQNQARFDLRALEKKIPALSASIKVVTPLAESIPDWDAAGRPLTVLGAGEPAAHPERTERGEALLEAIRFRWMGLKGMGAGHYKSIAEFPSGVQLQMSRPADGEDIHLRLFGGALDEPIWMRNLDADSALKSTSLSATASGILTRVENAYAAIATRPQRLQHDLERAISDKDLAAVRADGVFPDADRLTGLRVELQQIKMAIEAAQNSPEERARREAAQLRLASSGREPGWSLQWNPTKQMLEESPCDSVDRYRAAVQIGEARRSAEWHRTHAPDGRELTPSEIAANVARRGLKPIGPMNSRPQPPTQSTRDASPNRSTQPREPGPEL